MSKLDFVKILVDEDGTLFENRVDEIDSSVSYDAVKHTISRLKRALYDNPSVPALCAPQIGDNLRLFVVRLSKTETNRFKVFLNPLIVCHEGMHLSREVNPSFRDKQFIIPRYNNLHLAYQEEDGKVNSETHFGPFAEVVQQMVELLDGIPLTSYALDLDDVGGPEAFDKATKKDRTTVLATYLSQLKSMSEDLKTDIEDSSNLKAINDEIEFMTGVLKGDIKPLLESEAKQITDRLEEKNKGKKE